MSFFARLSCLLIRIYQRYVSPCKGYSCAHRALHGGASCSEFTRLALLDRGLLRAGPLLWHRLLACQAAAVQLRALASTPDSEPVSDRLRRKGRAANEACTNACCLALLVDWLS